MLESPTIVTRQDILSIFNRLQLRILKTSYFSELTTSKKKNLLESFEEVSFTGGEGSFKPGNVLEIEGKES